MRIVITDTWLVSGFHFVQLDDNPTYVVMQGETQVTVPLTQSDLNEWLKASGFGTLLG